MLFCTYSWRNPSHTLWGGWGRWYYLHLVRWDVQAQNVRGLTLTGRVPPRHQNPSPQSPSRFPSCGAIPASQGEGTAVWCPGAHRADLSSNPTPVSWGSSFHSYNRRHGSTCSQRLLATDRRTSEEKHTLLRTQPGLLISASGLNTVYHMPFFFLLQALNCKEAEITDSEPMAFIFFRIQNFSGFTFFLWPMFKNWETAQKTQDFPNFLEHETFHSNTRSTFLPGNNLLDLGRDSNFREYTHSPVDPSPHHSLMPFSSLTTHLFILLPGSGSNFICRFSDTKTTEGQATGTVKTQPRARQMTCTHQHCEFSS